MLSRNLKVIRYAGIFIFVAALCSVLIYPSLRGESAPPGVEDLQKQLEQVKTEMENKGSTPALVNQYSRIELALSKCGVINQITEPTIKAPFAPANSLCINGAIAGTDPLWNHPAVQAALPGLAPGCPAGSVSANYDAYSFNLTGCAVFPTEITATLCGPAGCLPASNLDTTLFIYRNVPAGDPLTANGGLPGVFNAASPCTNVRGAHDSLNGGASSNPGTGATCNQVNTANCLGACTGTTAVSGFRRQVGNGRFTIVVSGFNTTDAGPYNLYVNAPAAGCTVALAPTAASATIGGQVRTAGGNGISKATVTLSGNGIETMQARTNGFGYYSFGEVPVGDNYVLTVNGTKMYTFSNPTRVISLESNITDADFVSEQ